MRNLTIFLVVIYGLQILNIICNDSNKDIIELISNDIIPKKNDEKYYYLAFLHTTDIHGVFFPKKRTLPSGGEYSIGGLEYLGKYISIMKEEWGDQFMYFDSGDQFQGSIEGDISHSEMIMDFFNEYNLQNAALGNHEFDYGLHYLKRYMNSAKFDFLVSNIKNKTNGKPLDLPNFKGSKILELKNGIKIGIIGLTTLEIEKSKTNNASDIIFQDYLNIVKEESKQLREKGANAIIVLGHLGISCNYKTEEKNHKRLYKYGIRNKQTLKEKDKEKDFKHCKSKSEGLHLLNKIEPGILDLFLGGHTHSVAHHWINDIPLVSNERNGQNAHIIYLPFDRETHKLNNDLIQIEGPIPICEKIFETNHRCNFDILNEGDELKYGKLKNYNFHGKLIEKDEKAKNVAKKYQTKFDSYEKDILTKSNDYFEATRLGENTLGNLYTDFLRQISGADISIINTNSLRTPLYKGVITNATIQSFDTLNFKIVKFNAYGWEIKKIISEVQIAKKGLYPISGLKIVMNEIPKKVVSIKIFDGQKEYDIEDEKLYSIASTNFLFPIKEGVKGGDDFKNISKWFKPKNAEYIKNEFGSSYTKDNFIEYLRNIEVLKADKHYDEENKRIRIINYDSDSRNEVYEDE